MPTRYLTSIAGNRLDSAQNTEIPPTTYYMNDLAWNIFLACSPAHFVCVFFTVRFHVRLVQLISLRIFIFPLLCWHDKLKVFVLLYNLTTSTQCTSKLEQNKKKRNRNTTSFTFSWPLNCWQPLFSVYLYRTLPFCTMCRCADVCVDRLFSLNPFCF